MLSLVCRRRDKCSFDSTGLLDLVDLRFAQPADEIR